MSEAPKADKKCNCRTWPEVWADFVKKTGWTPNKPVNTETQQDSSNSGG